MIKAGKETSVTVTLSKNDTEWKPYSLNSYFPVECERQIQEADSVEAINISTQVSCEGINMDGIIPENELNQGTEEDFFESEEEKNAGKITLAGVEDISKHWNFEKYGDEISEGRGIEKSDAGKMYAVVSERFLTHNRAKIGDMLRVCSCFDDKKELELEIIGTHTGNYSGSKAYQSDCNIIYVPLDIALVMNGGGIMEAQYILKSENSMQSFINKAKVIGKTYQIDFDILKDNRDYLTEAGTIKGVHNTSRVMVLALFGTMSIVLCALLAYSLSERTGELGILLAIGEKKVNLMIQIWFETLVPVITGNIMGACIWAVICKYAASEIKMTLYMKDVWSVFGTALVISIIAAILPCLVVIKQKTREMLERTE